MNASIREVSGTYQVVRFVPADKLEQIADLLGLNDAEKAALKTSGAIVVEDKQ